MEKLKLIGLLIIITSSLMFIQCTTDVIVGPSGVDGIDGIDGISGIDGINGIDGLDGADIAECIACHSDAHRAPIEAAYALSAHNIGLQRTDGSYRKHVYGSNAGRVKDDGSIQYSRGFCALCHNNEGYQDRINKGTFNPSGYYSTISITCTGCHRNTVHRSLDFENDGNDYTLRQIDEVKELMNPTNFISVADEGEISSTSNTCIMCHQVRPDRYGYFQNPLLDSTEEDFDGNLVVDPTAMVDGIPGGTITYWRSKQYLKEWYPYPASTTYTNNYSNNPSLHANAQANVFIGMTGIAIAGSATQLPSAKSSAHFRVKCVGCHMDTPSDDATEGSHTFQPSKIVCLNCHQAGGPEEVTGFDTAFEELRATLSSKTAYFNTSSSSGNVSLNLSNPASGDPVGTTNTLVVPLKYAQAYWNYLLLRSDGNLGLHNPPYAMALIANSIEALQ